MTHALVGALLRASSVSAHVSAHVSASAGQSGASPGPFARPDWSTILVPDQPLLEIFLRGTIVYLALFFLLRVILRRQAATLGITDLLVVVLIADAAQNAMADDYRSVPDGVLLVAVIIGWAWALDALSFHLPWLERVIRPSALLLVKEGQPLLRNMRKELVTREELLAQLREQGVSSLDEVREARMESDGSISVLTADAGDRQKHPRRSPI